MEQFHTFRLLSPLVWSCVALRNPPVTLCHSGRDILWSLARVKDVLSPCGVHHLSCICIILDQSSKTFSHSSQSWALMTEDLLSSRSRESKTCSHRESPPPTDRRPAAPALLGLLCLCTTTIMPVYNYYRACVQLLSCLCTTTLVYDKYLCAL